MSANGLVDAILERLALHRAEIIRGYETLIKRGVAAAFKTTAVRTFGRAAPVSIPIRLGKSSGVSVCVCPCTTNMDQQYSGEASFEASEYA